AKRRIGDLARQWIAKRHLMIYAEDAALQSFFEYYGLAGTVAQIPRETPSDYLAVVNANIGGGKTDRVVKQNIRLESVITAEGAVHNRLAVSRAHAPRKGDAWWYRVPNQNYMKVFAPLSSELTSFSGGVEKKITPRVSYKANGYESDPLVAAVEATVERYEAYPAVRGFTESGKKVFAAWSLVKPEGKTELVFEYTHTLPEPLRAGERYRFVFERQAGAEGAYRFEIAAPAGLRWKESKFPVFVYETGDPDGRMIFDLTLEKI
ncbi:MAG: hypothetical protein AAB967_02155, partial [Patescibacteria group bacterium]